VLANVQGAKVGGNGFTLQGQYNAIRGYYNCEGRCVTVNAAKTSLNTAKPTILGGTFIGGGDQVARLDTTYATFLPGTAILRGQDPNFPSLTTNVSIPIQNLGTVTYRGRVSGVNFQNPSLVSSVSVDNRIDERLWDI
jgi:hypothetical protein